MASPPPPAEAPPAAALTSDAAQLRQIEAVQLTLLRRLRASRQALERFEAGAASRVDEAVREVRMHCELLRMVRRDMDDVYRRVRAMRERLQRLPEARTASGGSGQPAAG